MAAEWCSGSPRSLNSLPGAVLALLREEQPRALFPTVSVCVCVFDIVFVFVSVSDSDQAAIIGLRAANHRPKAVIHRQWHLPEYDSASASAFASDSDYA